MRIAIIGTDGIPARYGGFETFVEQVAPQLVALGHTVTVVGSSLRRSEVVTPVRGVDIINLPIAANGAASVLFDAWSAWTIRKCADAVLVLGVSGGVFFPLITRMLRGRPLLINVDGLETQRAKWTGFKRRFLALSERLAIRCADWIVSDNQGIADIVRDCYGRTSCVIAYGNDHVRDIDHVLRAEVLAAYGLTDGSYSLTVARIEPENNISMMIAAHLVSGAGDYVIIGNFKSTPYGREITARYKDVERVRLMEPIFDPTKLAAFRGGCALYLHGHSVGGTNPSLVEMLPYRRPILAYDCVFNRATLRNAGGYFNSQQNLAENLSINDFAKFIPPQSLLEDHAYSWRKIAAQYADLAGLPPLRKGRTAGYSC